MARSLFIAVLLLAAAACGSSTAPTTVPAAGATAAAAPTQASIPAATTRPTTTPTKAITPAAPTGVGAPVTLTAAEIRGLTHHGISSAVAELTQKVGGSLDRVTIAAAEQITFPDAELGYPEPETSYAQALTEGIMLVLLYEQQEFDYRISGIHGLLCENAQPFQAVERRPLEGLWSRLADLPTSRSEVAVAELDGKIYVLGGFGEGATANEEYDPATDPAGAGGRPYPEKWTTRPQWV